MAPSVLAASAEYRYDRPRDDTSHDARAGSTRAFDDRSEAGEALHLECLRKRSGRSLPAAATWQSVGHRACRSPAVGVARNLPQRVRISAPRRPDAEVRNGASGTTFCRDRLTITVDTIAFREARERDSLAARYLPGCRVIAEREVFLNHWQSADSLDERYFAMLPTTAIIGRADPLWTNEDN